MRTSTLLKIPAGLSPADHERAAEKIVSEGLDGLELSCYGGAYGPVWNTGEDYDLAFLGHYRRLRRLRLGIRVSSLDGLEALAASLEDLSLMQPPGRDYKISLSPLTSCPRLTTVATGRVIGEAQLQCHAAGSHHVPHPDGEHVGLSVGEGQDGSEVYWGRWAGAHQSVRRLDARTRVLVDVRPDGQHNLTTPHGQPGALRVHAFSAGAMVAERQDSDTFPDEDWFDFQAGYVTQDLIVAGSVETQVHVLIHADDVGLIAEIEYPAGACKESILTGEGSTWLTTDYVKGRFQAWRLANR